MNRMLFAALSLLAVLTVPVKALAHAVETNYILDGPGLEFQSTYSTGEPLQGATVQIFAPSNPDKPWMEITADDEGRFAFTPDTSIPGDWEVVIRKEGHDDFWTVPVDKQGVEFDQIGEGPKGDIHYASSPLALTAVAAMAAVASGVCFIRRRQLVE
ncbi:MAG TPA: carboxypeptidase-like regulatory domain-containing protein [Leptolyngbyaceae cyanobacterium]